MPANTANRMKRVAETYVHATLYWQAVSRLLGAIRWQLQGRGHNAEEKQRVAAGFEALHDACMAKELEAWRNAAIFGLAVPQEVNDELRQLVFARFFREPYAIMHHLADDHEMPTRYLSAKEDIFRAMLTHAFRVDDAAWRRMWDDAKAADTAYTHPLEARPLDGLPPVRVRDVPVVEPREPDDPTDPDGYEESDDDFFRRNREAAIWFLENRDALVKALRAAPERAAAAEG